MPCGSCREFQSSHGLQGVNCIITGRWLSIAKPLSVVYLQHRTHHTRFCRPLEISTHRNRRVASQHTFLLLHHPCLRPRSVCHSSPFSDNLHRRLYDVLALHQKRPTLDPDAMNPPALDPDGKKMREDELANFIENIR